MNLLFKKQTKEIKKEELLDPTTISVESIQGMLIKEFNLNSSLKEKVQVLEDDLITARELAEQYKLKYEATLLVANEKEKRLKDNEKIIELKDCEISNLKSQKDRLTKENNDYYSKCMKYEREKDKLTKNITKELELSHVAYVVQTLENTEKQILSSINELDGRISKKAIIDIIKNRFELVINEEQTIEEVDYEG